MREEENPGECECCGFVTDELELYRNMPTTIAGGGSMVERDFWFCGVCTGTMASTVYRFPSVQIDSMDVMKSISYSTNLILQRINELKGKT